MVGKTPRIRKDERERLDTIKLYCGCLACLLTGHLDRHTTIEHVTERGRRVGSELEQHWNTVGLCTWHHFGACDSGQQKHQMGGELGPSLAHGRHNFEEFFGDEVKVLIPIQNFMLALFAEQPWPEYSVPRQIVRDVRSEWIDLNHANAQLSLPDRSQSG